MKKSFRGLGLVDFSCNAGARIDIVQVDASGVQEVGDAFVLLRRFILDAFDDIDAAVHFNTVVFTGFSDRDGQVVR